VNPVRRSPTFQRDGSHGALNPVFAPKRISCTSPLQAAGLSNGVNLNVAENKYPIGHPLPPLKDRGGLPAAGRGGVKGETTFNKF